jgi:hypothetical protein
VSAIVAGEHLKFEGGPRLQHPVIAAVAFGWPRTVEMYDLKVDHQELVWFLSDLLGGARGPFSPLLLAIADAASKHWNITEDLNVSIEEDGFPDWWRLKETADPVVHALAYALACMHGTVTASEWEENR